MFQNEDQFCIWKRTLKLLRVWFVFVMKHIPVFSLVTYFMLPQTGAAIHTSFTDTFASRGSPLNQAWKLPAYSCHAPATPHHPSPPPLSCILQGDAMNKYLRDCSTALAAWLVLWGREGGKTVSCVGWRVCLSPHITVYSLPVTHKESYWCGNIRIIFQGMEIRCCKHKVSLLISC